jgi:hypothetical protein
MWRFGVPHPSDVDVTVLLVLFLPVVSRVLFLGVKIRRD